MPERRTLITGATGLLGSHIVEKLLQKEHSVRALVRTGTDTAWLKERGVELVFGDLSRAETLQAAFANVSTVFHCAAKVGDWGTWRSFQDQTVRTTQNVVRACHEADVERLLHVSSVAAYGHPSGKGDITERAPLGQNLWLWDYYARSKMAAEAEVLDLGDRVTIVRPTWIFGPRDRAVIPRIAKAVQTGRATLVGSGNNRLNMVYAEDVAAGVVAAAQYPNAAGQTYNLCGVGEITQRTLFDALADGLSVPRIRRSVPLWLVYQFAFAAELAYRATGRRYPPIITRHGASLISRASRFSSAKAREELGWEPRVPAMEGLARTIAWLRGPVNQIVQP